MLAPRCRSSRLGKPGRFELVASERQAGPISMPLPSKLRDYNVIYVLNSLAELLTDLINVAGRTI